MEGSQEKENIQSTEDNVYLVYKNIGETPLEVINRFRKSNNKFSSSSITYAGRLDPMAEGLLILLTDEKVHEKEHYLNLEKTYEIEILWGVGTDTEDLLGIITDTKFQIPNKDAVEDYLKKSVGVFEQNYPAYSSKPVNGKPLFAWAREGKLHEVQIPSHEVSIFNTEYLERKEILSIDLYKILEERIKLVSGDFRQKEILKKWEQVLRNSSQNYIIDKFTVSVSSGFYVRQFVSDMAKHFETAGTTFYIKRLKIGEYTIAS